MFNPLNSITNTNQQHFKQQVCKEVTMNNFCYARKPPSDVLPPNQHLVTVSKDDCDTKEGTSKFMKNPLYVL